MNVLRKRGSVSLLTAVTLVGLGLAVTTLAAESPDVGETVQASTLVTPGGEENGIAMLNPGGGPERESSYHCCEDTFGSCTTVSGSASCPLWTTEVDCPCPDL